MSIKGKIVTAFGVSILALAALCCGYQLSMVKLLEARRWVEHTQLVVERLEMLVSLCKDLETGQRGFCLAGQEEFLEPFRRALQRIPLVTAQVRELTKDNPTQQNRLDRLEALEADKIDFTQRAVAETRTNGAASGVAFTRTMRGKRIMDAIRAVVSEMQEQERILLNRRIQEADRIANLLSIGIIVSALLATAVIGAAAFSIVRAFSQSVSKLQSGLDRIGAGSLDFRIESSPYEEFAKLGSSFNDMAAKLAVSQSEIEAQSWLNAALEKFGRVLQGERSLSSAGDKALRQFAEETKSLYGMIYLNGTNGDGKISLLSGYANSGNVESTRTFSPGTGLIGQCVLEKKRLLVADLPDDYIQIVSGVGQAAPKHLCIIPVIFEHEVVAVIEQASFSLFTDSQLQFLEQAAENLGIILNSIAIGQQTEQLLRQEQTLTEELQSQQEELSEGNKKLEALTRSLQSSEEELRQQQEELQQTNEELEERTRIQTEQNEELESKNIELENLRQSMEEKAQQLSVTSKYKSEFLSNMSHELRTPLNSLLVLSKVLYENNGGNLTPKQVEFARTIHSAGADLLVLIDDVLDISKIEAGAMSVDIVEEPLHDICTALINSLALVAREKGIALTLEFDPVVPPSIRTDGRRLQQVLKNILSNALKFTEKGSVILRVMSATQGWSRDNHVLNAADSVVSLSVIDTGIGIARDKQNIIFEAFQQADGTTNRKFGGTGLGLAICRELVQLLGGEIRLQSEAGKGSIFTVFMPREYAGAAPQLERNPEVEFTPADLLRRKTVEVNRPGDAGGAPEDGFFDDRATINSGDKILLVVHQDAEFSKQLANLARSRGFKVIWATRAKSAFALVQRFKPHAVTLDVGLPDKEGWIFLDRLKRDSTTRHIPVHVISEQELSQRARRLGAFGYSTKPDSQQAVIEMVNHLNAFVSREERHLLIVEDNAHERESLEHLIEGADVKVTAVSTGREGLSALAERKYDCLVLDLGLPDMTGFEFIDQLHENSDLRDLPIIVHTSKSLTAQEELRLRRTSGTVVIKGAKSTERLLDETTLFLHRVESRLPEHKRKILEQFHLRDPLLTGRKILIVDDDMRHIFAVTSLLEQYETRVVYAENGVDALELLEKNTDVDLILMDVMMPHLDGYQTMRAIRDHKQYAKVPIIALTAKAMKGDREQCIAAGASDYLSKPVDSDQLLSLMRVWLY